MRNILSLLLLLGAVSCFSQNDLSWYKMLQGNIGTYPVTMHLHKSGHEYRGYYYYDNFQELLSFFGDDTTNKGKITLSMNEEQFSFTLNSGAANGTWVKPNTKSLVFTATEIKPPIGFTYVYSSGIAKLKPKWPESPQATINQSSAWPTGTGASDIFVKKLIREHFGERTSQEEIGAIFIKTKKNTFNSYVNDYKTLSDDEIRASSMAYSLEIDDELMVCYQSAKVISLAGYSYSYTGGAHGNYGTTYMALNLVTNKKLTVDDIVTKEGVKVLGTLLEKNFRRQFQLKPTEKLTDAGLFENKILPNKNFFVTGRGMGFAFQPYEIGPYAMGEIDIYIPFSDLKKYLKPEFKTLVGYSD